MSLPLSHRRTDLCSQACVRLDGTSDGPAKNALIDRFRSERRVLVALVSTTACGAGVNGFQTVADQAFFCELPQDQGWKGQAEARLHRSGQSEPVTVVYLLAEWEREAAVQPSAALLRECERFDERQWATLRKTEETIASVVSGQVQRQAHPAGAGGGDSAADAGDADDAASATAFFAVSRHTRRVHAYSSRTSARPTGESFSAVDLLSLLDCAKAYAAAPARARLAARFFEAWAELPAQAWPRLHGVPSARSGLRRLAKEAEAAAVSLDGRREASTLRCAPSRAPSALEQARAPRGALWIRAAVEEGLISGRSAQLEHHWQPALFPDGGEGAQLLCVNCFAPLLMAERAKRLSRADGDEGEGEGEGGHSADGAPEHSCRAWGVRYERVADLTCGEGECFQAWVLRRNPSAVRHKLRKAYVAAVGSLFCQGCGVDLLRLASALKALPVDERQQLLRQRVPHLEQWAGKWTRAICEPTEGHLWEADHIREVRHGGGEAGLANFQPLCVACHQLKTNRNSAAEARRRRQAAFQERETPPSSPPLTPTQLSAARKRDASAGSAAADEPRRRRRTSALFSKCVVSSEGESSDGAECDAAASDSDSDASLLDLALRAQAAGAAGAASESDRGQQRQSEARAAAAGVGRQRRAVRCRACGLPKKGHVCTARVAAAAAPAAPLPALPASAAESDDFDFSFPSQPLRRTGSEEQSRRQLQPPPACSYFDGDDDEFSAIDMDATVQVRTQS